MPVFDHDLQSDRGGEECLLGIALQNPAQVISNLKLLQPGHFAFVAHGLVYESLRARVFSGLPADLETLESDFALSGVLEPIGGASALRRFVALPIVRSPELLEHHLIDLWQRRQLVVIGNLAADDMHELVLSARGGSQQSGEQLARGAVLRLAEIFALAQAVCSPLPDMLTGRPSDISVVVNLLNIEVRELAQNHDLIAEVEEKDGSVVNATARRSRASQLRGMVGEPAA